MPDFTPKNRKIAFSPIFYPLFPPRFPITTTHAPHSDAGFRAVYRAVSRLISRPTRCGIPRRNTCVSRSASRAGSRRKFYATFCAHSTYLGVFQVIFANKQRICSILCRRALPFLSPLFRHFPTKKTPAKGACP